MSVMQIDHATFRDLAHTLAGIDYTGNGSKYQMVGHNLVNRGDRFGFDVMQKNNKEHEGLHRLMGYLAAMNHRAFRSRYSGEKHVFIKYPEYIAPLKRLSIYQVLKSLEAIKYNIDIDCNYLDQIIIQVQSALIENIPEYDRATWG